MRYPRSAHPAKHPPQKKHLVTRFPLFLLLSLLIGPFASPGAVVAWQQQPHKKSSGDDVHPEGQSCLGIPRIIKQCGKITRISPTHPVTQSLRAEEAQAYCYEFGLSERQYLQALVKQKDIDVVVSLIGPPDKGATERIALSQVDRPSGNRGNESLSWVAEKEGVYQLQVYPLGILRQPGEFSISIAISDNPRLSDMERIRAEAAVSEGEQFRALQTSACLSAALERFDFARRIWRKLEDHYELAIALYGMGLAYYTQGDYNRAVNVLVESAALMNEQKDGPEEKYIYGEVAARNRLAWLYLSLGAPVMALDHFREALKIRELLEDNYGKALSLFGLGSAQAALNDHAAAMNSFSKSLELRVKLGDLQGEAVVLNGVGTLYRRRGQHQKAVDVFEQARHKIDQLKREGKSGAREIEANLLVNLGAASYETTPPNYALAREYLEGARRIANDIGARLTEAGALYYSARAALGEQKRIESLALIAKAVEMIEELFWKGKDFQLRTSYNVSIRDYYEFYIDLLMQLHRQNPERRFDVSALQVSERMRTNGLLDWRNEASVEICDGVSAELIKEKRRLWGEFQVKYSPAKLDRRDDIIDKIRLENPRAAELLRPRQVNIDELSKSLQEDELVLEYALGKDRAYLWALTREGVRSFSLSSTPIEISNRVGGVVEMLAATGGLMRKFETRVQALTSALLPESLSQISKGKSKLIIAPDGPLFNLPFAVLSSSSAGRPYEPLMVKYEIILIPSVSALDPSRRLPVGRDRNSAKTAIFVDPVFRADEGRTIGRRQAASIVADASSKDDKLTECSPSSSPFGAAGGAEKIEAIINRLPELPDAGQEAEAIKRINPQSIIFRRFDANLERVKSGLSGFDYIHFAVQGAAYARESDIKLVLSTYDESGRRRDGLLGAGQVHNLNLSAELVFLSACDTGLGKTIYGDWMAGLASGFLHAGAKHVIASLWLTDDGGTLELVKSFYRMMIPENVRPTQALRQAQLAMWKSGKWPLASYMAFVAYGERR